MKKTFLIFFIFIGQLFALDLNFNTFSSNFTQIVKSKNSTLSYSGHFILSKDQAYWSYDTPSKKEIYINKNQVTIVEHDLERFVFCAGSSSRRSFTCKSSAKFPPLI